MTAIRYVMCTVAVLVVVSVAAGAVGELKPVEVETAKRLTYEQFSARTDDFGKAGPDAGTVHPKVVVATLRSGGVTIAAAIDADAPDAPGANVLRLDLTGEGRFADALTVPLRPRAESPSSYFMVDVGPAVVTVVRDGVSLPVTVEGLYYKRRGNRYRYLRLSLLTAREGVCDFGGKTRRVRVVDCTNDLTVNTPSRLGSKKGRPEIAAHGDTILVDLGGGTFSSETTAKAMVGQPVLVDGRWYDMKVSDDQKRLTAAPLKKPTGMLHVDQGKWWIRLLSADRLVAFQAGPKPVPVPAGSYEIVSGGHEYFAPTPGVLLLDNKNVEPVIVKIEPGKTAELPFGSPVMLRIKTKVVGRKVSMDLVQADSAGLNVKALVVGADRMPPRPAPRLKVLDAAGNIVHRGNFEYG